MADEKQKILYLMRILLEETDREHILNAVELCEKLESRYEISCNRKTIYGDIERLKSFGLDIDQVKGNRQGYFVASRRFELPELKLLVDAVQASKFITAEKSESLIRRLEGMTSASNASKLRRQVFIYDRAKTDNETIFANVDTIHEAIQANQKVTFRYCEWNVKKQLVERHGGAEYKVSPWSLIWDDENYYLVACDDKYKSIRHYRVDKMKKIALCQEVREGRELFNKFDLAAFVKKTFGMFGGEDRQVTLLCRSHLAGVVIDRFGRDVMLIPRGADHFTVRVNVAVSPQFFGWLAGIGSGMKIEEPRDVAEEYTDYLKGILAEYEADTKE